MNIWEEYRKERKAQERYCPLTQRHCVPRCVFYDDGRCLLRDFVKRGGKIVIDEVDKD